MKPQDKESLPWLIVSFIGAGLLIWKIGIIAFIGLVALVLGPSNISTIRDKYIVAESHEGEEAN
jgi:hypothetical protein